MAADRFPTAMRGYHKHEVDAVMARVDAALGRAPLLGLPITAQELRQMRFGVGMRGYDQPAVNTAMLEAAAALGGPLEPYEPYGQAGPGVLGNSPDDARDRMLAEIRGVKFPRTRLRPGYDMAEVDHFLDEVVAALTGSGRPLTARDVEAMAFTTTNLRSGYDEESVDDLLDSLATYLKESGSG